ncbi:MAG: hypothetical protein R3F14_47755, partial [Polyangiaceae bacterium]
MDWPYGDDDGTQLEESAPSWECPDESCHCREQDLEAEQVEVSILLFDPIGERMAGALCRVLYQGRVLNQDQPNADGSGWVTVL